MERNVAVLLVGWTLVGCQRAENTPPPAGVVAKVGATAIRLEDLQAHLSAEGPLKRPNVESLDGRKQLLEEVIRFELVAQEAKRRGLDKDPVVRRAIEKELVDRMLTDELDRKFKATEVSLADIESYYREHQPEFSREPQVRISHILVNEHAESAKVARAARSISAAAFAALASKHSVDHESRGKGGDLGFLGPHQAGYLALLAERGFAMKVGEVSDPIRTYRGFHVLRVMETKPLTVPPISEVSGEIRNRLYERQRALYQQQRARRGDEWLARLRASTRVEIFEDRLAGPRVPLDPSPPAAARK